MSGKLKSGATIEQARQQIDALNGRNLERFPQYREVLVNARFHTTVATLQDQIVRDVKPTLYLLWGGAIFVLLIGSVNVANLVLVRTAASPPRARHANRARRQPLAESPVSWSVEMSC